MSTQTTPPVLERPTQVHEFVEQVRLLLADLDPEEQQDLVSGLEADLGDLVAERGSEALGDPATYARELRVAAGHSPVMAPRPGGRTFREAVMDAIDSAHASWDRLLDSLPGDLRGFLTAVQPAWWVLRAVVALLVVQDLRGPYIVIDVTWLLILAVFVVVSVQLGRRAWGLDRLLSRSVVARLGLVALNVLAVGMIPGSADNFAWHIAEERAYQFQVYEEDVQPAYQGITYQGGQVCDLEVRRADGKVVPDAYVWDLTGDRPLPMHVDMC
jgi:hypothetical protein